MITEQTAREGTTIEVDTDEAIHGHLSLTLEQAHELGGELIRAAERVQQGATA